jgi:tetratricopeptide (TPR) repeat protein
MRRGLEIGSKDRALLNQARQYLSFALFERGYFYEAAVVGRYLSTTSPSDSVGLGGGLIALSSLQNALKSASEEETLAITRQIESLGELLTRQWPDDPKAVAAKGIMVRMALEKDRWDDAKKLIEGMPDGDEKANYKRLLGMLTWNRSLMLRQDKKNAEADALLPEAAAVLREGLDGIPGVLSGPEVLQAALVLAKIELRRDDAVAALAVLDHEKYGPLPLVEKLGEPSDGFKSDIYSAELQAVVGVMTSDGSDTAALLTRATDTMDRLQESVKGKPDASTRLVRIYVNMATDIRAQLESATPEKKAKLVNAFRIFLDSIAKSSEDPATLQWVGQTLMQMGEASMAPGERVAQGQAKELLTSAATTLAGLVTKQGKDAAPALKFQLAKAYRLNGEYKKSVDLLHEVLSVNQMMLDAQIEAATAYEYWAGSIQPNYAANAYKSALVGARPDKNGKNVIWGWGRIQKLVSGRPELQETFFDARYHLAVCRYLMGKSLKDNKVIDQAQKDVTQVAALYPELGGPEKRAQFDLLLKEIQKSLGKKPEGLPPLPAAAG